VILAKGLKFSVAGKTVVTSAGNVDRKQIDAMVKVVWLEEIVKRVVDESGSWLDAILGHCSATHGARSVREDLIGIKEIVAKSRLGQLLELGVLDECVAPLLGRRGPLQPSSTAPLQCASPYSLLHQGWMEDFTQASLNMFVINWVEVSP